MKFVIPGRLMSLNEYIRYCRASVYAANDHKKKDQQRVKEAIREAKLSKTTKYPLKVKITWYESNSKRDVDNVSFGVKMILDAMVDMRIITDDSQKYIKEIRHDVRTDKDNPRIEVEYEPYCEI